VPELPPAGWYENPDGTLGTLRYWDGSDWAAESVRYKAPLRPDRADRLPVPARQEGSPWGMYKADLKWSANALRRDPLLAVITIATFVALEFTFRMGHRPNGWLIFFAFAAELYLAGFVGLQRVWFLRKLRNVSFSAREYWTMPWRFFGQFFRLSVLISIISIPVFIPLIVTTLPPPGTRSTDTTPFPTSVRILLFAWSFLGDVLLTFVIPALSLNVRSARDAIRLGWRTMKRTWPVNAWYLFTPGLTLFALSALLPQSVIPIGLALAIGVVSGLLGLWFKGAVVAFYVRSVPPASIDGSLDVRDKSLLS